MEKLNEIFVNMSVNKTYLQKEMKNFFNFMETNSSDFSYLCLKYYSDNRGCIAT